VSRLGVGGFGDGLSLALQHGVRDAGPLGDAGQGRAVLLELGGPLRRLVVLLQRVGEALDNEVVHHSGGLGGRQIDRRRLLEGHLQEVRLPFEAVEEHHFTRRSN
jgi:hypothetical protein